MQKPPSFTMDAESAKTAGIQKNTRIATSGAYVGTITKAKAVESKNTGAFGIEFDFKAESGETANGMTLWLSSANGEVFGGFKAVADSIAYCLKQKSYDPVMTRIMEWDYNARAEAEVQAWCYPALMGKLVGLILQAEEYVKNSGEIGRKMNIVGAFGAHTRKMPVELADPDSKTELLERVLLSLKDKTVKQQQGAMQKPLPPQQSQAFEDFVDDIPF